MGLLRDLLMSGRVWVVAPPDTVRGVCWSREDAEAVIRNEGLVGYKAQGWHVGDAKDANAGPMEVDDGRC